MYNWVKMLEKSKMCNNNLGINKKEKNRARLGYNKKELKK